MNKDQENTWKKSPHMKYGTTVTQPGTRLSTCIRAMQVLVICYHCFVFSGLYVVSAGLLKSSSLRSWAIYYVYLLLTGEKGCGNLRKYRTNECPYFIFQIFIWIK